MSTIEQLQKLYLSVLEEDYKVHVDDDGDVVFKHPDLGTLFLSLDERDPEYFHLVYPSFLDSKQAAELGVDEDNFFRLINDFNLKTKGGKVSLGWNDSDSTWNASITFEAFLAGADTVPSRELIAAIFGRCMNIIRLLRQDLYNEVHNFAENGNAAKGTVQ